MELALIVSLVVLTVVAVVGLLGYVIDRGAGRLER
jgi:preprotein translocase subunit SecE